MQGTSPDSPVAQTLSVPSDPSIRPPPGPAPDLPPDLPAVWHDSLRAQLATGEQVLAWLALNLDSQLRYADSLLVLTDRRWLACGAEAQTCRSWPLRPDLRLSLQDHAGVGTLDLIDPHARLARWRYTLDHHPQALRLAARYNALQQPDTSTAGTATPAAPPAADATETAPPPGLCCGCGALPGPTAASSPSA